MNWIDAHSAQKRDDLCRQLRAFMHERGFVEIHTPILLRPLPDTNGVRMDIKGEDYELRRCMELKLRSALANGLRAVFELGPCFRPVDAPSSRSHPEFYMLELFERELDYAGLMELTRDLLSVVSGNPALEFELIDVTEWLERVLGIEVEPGGDAIRSQLVGRGFAPPELATLPAFYAIDHVVEEHLEKGCGSQGRPAVLHRYPACTVCLARREAQQPAVIERFEVFVEGLEVAHGFVDEMNAEDVLARMKESGPEFTDEAFVDLLRSGGLPPSAGVGFGVERLLLAFNKAPSVHDLIHENQFRRL